MFALADEFEGLVRSSKIHTRRQKVDNGLTIHIHGRNGLAEVMFSQNGKIQGMIEGEMIHTWEVFPNSSDIQASAKKIREIIG